MVEYINPAEHDEETLYKRFQEMKNEEYIARKRVADKKASIRSKRYYNKKFTLHKNMTEEEKEIVMKNIQKRREYNRMRYAENKEVREKSKKRQQEYRERQRRSG